MQLLSLAHSKISVQSLAPETKLTDGWKYFSWRKCVHFRYLTKGWYSIWKELVPISEERETRRQKNRQHLWVDESQKGMLKGSRTHEDSSASAAIRAIQIEITEYELVAAVDQNRKAADWRLVVRMWKNGSWLQCGLPQTFRKQPGSQRLWNFWRGTAYDTHSKYLYVHTGKLPNTWGKWN